MAPAENFADNLPVEGVYSISEEDDSTSVFASGADLPLDSLFDIEENVHFGPEVQEEPYLDHHWYEQERPGAGTQDGEFDPFGFGFDLG